MQARRSLKVKQRPKTVKSIRVNRQAKPVPNYSVGSAEISSSTSISVSSTDRGSTGRDSTKSIVTPEQKPKKNFKKKKKVSQQRSKQNRNKTKYDKNAITDNYGSKNVAMENSATEEEDLSKTLSACLRWTGECSDSEEERKRIYNYKVERRKRYSEAVYRKIYS